MLKTITRFGYPYSKLLLAVGVGFFLLSSPVNSAATTSIVLQGVILPMTHEEGLNRYVLEFQDRQSVLQVNDVRLLGFSGNGGNISGWSVLNSIGRQRILVRGADEENIRNLTQPEEMCKGVRLEGTLYVSNGTLLLGSVSPMPDANRHDGCE